MSEGLGRVGRRRPVRGILYCFSFPGGFSLSPNAISNSSSSLTVSPPSSSCSGIISRSGNAGVTSGRELVIRRSKSRQTALAISRRTTIRQRTRSPRRLAVISHSSSVYCIIANTVAVRL